MNKLKKRPGMIVIELSTVIISVSRFRGNGYFYFVLNLLYYFKFLIVRMNYTCNDKNIWKWFKSPNPTRVFHRTLTSYRPHLHLLLISPSSPPPPHLLPWWETLIFRPLDHPRVACERCGVMDHLGWVRKSNSLTDFKFWG